MNEKLKTTKDSRLFFQNNMLEMNIITFYAINKSIL